MSEAELEAMGFLGPAKRNPYGCGWTHPMSVYVAHCEDAHKYMPYPHVITCAHPADDCPCCAADRKRES